MVAHLKKRAAVLVGLCKKAIKAKAFREVSTYENELCECCILDPSCVEAGHAQVFTAAHTQTVKAIKECMRKLQDEADTSIGRDELDIASGAITHLEQMCCLSRLFTAEAVPIEDIHQRLQKQYSEKTDAFEHTVLILLEQEKFPRLTALLGGASELQSEESVVRGRDLVVSNCSQRFEKASQILCSAQKPSGAVAIPVQMQQAGALLSWFDRAAGLGSVLPGDSFQSWQRTLKIKTTALLGKVNARANRMLQRWAYAQVNRALQELEMYVDGFPEVIREMAVAMQSELKTELSKSLEGCEVELTEALEKSDGDCLNGIMGGIEALGGQEVSSDLTSLNTVQLLGKFNDKIKTTLVERCQKIFTELKQFKFVEAFAKIDDMAQLRSQSPLWVDRNLHAQQYSQAALHQHAKSQMESVLEVDWICDAGSPISHKTEVLDACRVANAVLYNDVTKSMTDALSAEIMHMKIDNLWEIRKAAEMATRLSSCLRVLPKSQYTARLQRARDQLSKHLIFQVEQKERAHREAKQANDYSGLGDTKPFLEYGCEALVAIKDGEDSEAPVLEALIKKVKNAIAPDEAFVQGLLTGHRLTSDLDLCATVAPFDPREKHTVGTIAWTFLAMKEKEKYIKTILALQGIGDQWSMIKVMEMKIKAGVDNVDRLWREGAYGQIEILRQNLFFIHHTFLRGRGVDIDTIASAALAAHGHINKLVNAKAASLEGQAFTEFDSLFISRTFSLAKIKAGIAKLNRIFAVAENVAAAVGGSDAAAQGVTVRTKEEMILAIVNRMQASVKEIVSKWSSTRTVATEVAPLIIKLHTIAVEMRCEGATKSWFESSIHTALDKCKEMQRQTPSFDIESLHVLLSADNMGAEVAGSSEFSVFKSFGLKRWKAQVIKMTFADALKNTMGVKENTITSKEEAQLLELHGIFETEYAELVELFKTEPDDDTRCKEVAEEVCSRFSSRSSIIAGMLRRYKAANSTSKITSVQYQVTLLVADVFALWSMTEVYDAGTKDASYKEPFGLQILAIFFLFGLNKVDDFISRNIRAVSERISPRSIKLEKSFFIQILTGQGKSITLGVLSACLALVGYRVDCVCFSPYLSKRDYAAFGNIFKALQVDSKIEYGTFGDLCDKLIKKAVDLRPCTEQLLTGQDVTVTTTGQSGEMTVALLDEVDVLFSEQFRGKSYNPAASVSTAAAKSLLDLAWRTKGSSGLKKGLLQSDAFKQLVAAAPACERVFRTIVDEMVSDLATLRTHSYKVKDGQIGYADGAGGISTTTSYGFKTLWAAYLENEKNSSFYVHKRFTPMCGQFSFAEIPLLYDVVLGVTGTLSSLPKPIMETLQTTYNVQKFMYMPSIFGPRKVTPWKGDKRNVIVAVNEANQHVALADKIQATFPRGQPVLLFLESDEAVEKFWESTYLRDLRKAGNFFKVGADTSNVQWHIENATRVTEAGLGHVTLFSRELGRGTDFAASAPSINEAGGVCVIMGFFADDVSEEQQTEGRTGRNGARGEFFLILEASRLLRCLKVTQSELDAQAEGNGMYAMLDQKRQAATKETCDRLDKAVIAMKAVHDKTIRYQKALKRVAANGSSANLEACVELLLEFL
jgi:hypothetical protein